MVELATHDDCYKQESMKRRSMMFLLDDCSSNVSHTSYSPNWVTSCTALVVGSDDVASCYSIGVLTRRQVGRREGSRGARVVASC